ncbi:MAG TPA: sigma-70 family RNA polymerase sigma factor [Chthonomonadaceae bacterium]|nr:sigma-70 family RNA polymerase sigma factor [Chthonomonadaceae bacterium]
MVGERVEPLQTGLQNGISEDREEADQVARARSGDGAAIDWLLARYRLRVVRLAAHILRRPGEAEDVAQEAFVRAFRNLNSFRGEGRFYTWLYQIVVRICLDRRRAARWDAEMPLEAASGSLAAPDAALNDVELRVLVETLLDRLAPPMRAMLVLRELEGLEYEEIARVLQIPVGRVRWRLHTARAQFQQLWRQALQEAEHV